LIIEWLERAQIDRAADSAFDEVGRLVLVYVHGADELGRDARPVERTAAVGRERVAAVELGPHKTQTTNQVAAAFGRREVRRRAAGGETRHRDTGDALQRFSDREVGKTRDVRRGDRIDECVGVALDLGRGLQRRANAGDDDGGDFLVICRCRWLRGILGRLTLSGIFLCLGDRRSDSHGERRRAHQQTIEPV
jgi:hypothetical protein